MFNLNNETTLGWLERALKYAFEEGKPELLAYLEAVLEELVLEMELDAPSPPLLTIPESVEDAGLV